MRVAGPEPVDTLLRGGGRNGGESMFAASDPRAVPGDSILWESSDDGVPEARRSCGESQASATADAVDGSGGDLSEAAVISGNQGTPQISLLAAVSFDQSRESGVGDGYHGNSTFVAANFSSAATSSG